MHSYFVLRAGHCVYYLFLAAFEIYSAAMLSLYTHGRHVFACHTGPSYEPDKITETIGPSFRQNIDGRNILHVCRPLVPPLVDDRDHSGFDAALDVASKTIGIPSHEPIFKEGDESPRIDFGLLIEVTKGLGKADKARSGDSWRVSLGFASRFGQICGFQKVWRHNESKGRTKKYLAEVGRIAAYVHSTMQNFQSAHGSEPLNTDRERNSAYAARLRDALYLPKNVEIGAEVVFICIMEVHPSCPTNHEHVDRFNSKKVGYNRVGCFSATVAGPDGKLYLVQLILVNRYYLDSVQPGSQWEFFENPDAESSVGAFCKELASQTPRKGRSTFNSKKASSVYNREMTGDGRGKEGYAMQLQDIQSPTLIVYHVGEEEPFLDKSLKCSVLEDKKMAVTLDSCVDLGAMESFHHLLEDFACLSWLRGETFGASYLSCSTDPGRGEFRCFPGHVDKAKFEKVLFIPLSGFFWTILAIPLYDIAGFGEKSDCTLEFWAWVGKLDELQRIEIEDYLEVFKKGATKELAFDFDIRIFRCQPGTALLFPPKIWFHGTIAIGGHGPKSNLILHALETTTS